MAINYDAAIDYDAVLNYDGDFPLDPGAGGGGGAGGSRYGGYGAHFGTAGGYDDIKKEVEKIYAELADEKTPVEIQQQAARVGMAFIDKPFSPAAIMPPPAAIDFNAMMRNLLAIELLVEQYKQKMEWEIIAVLMLSI